MATLIKPSTRALSYCTRKLANSTYDFQILEKIKSLIPEHIARLNEDDKIKSIMGWFKNDFMSWTPKDPICNR